MSNVTNIKYRNKEFKTLHEFKSYYGRMGAFYGYIGGSSLTFIFCYLMFNL